MLKATINTLYLFYNLFLEVFARKICEFSFLAKIGETNCNVHYLSTVVLRLSVPGFPGLTFWFFLKKKIVNISVLRIASLSEKICFNTSGFPEIIER